MSNKLKEFISLILEQEENWREATHVNGARSLFSQLKRRVPDAIIMDDSETVINSPEDITDDSRVFWGGQDAEIQSYGFTIKSNQLRDFLETNYDYILFNSYPKLGNVSLELYLNDGGILDVSEDTFDQALQALNDQLEIKKTEEREETKANAAMDHYDSLAQDQRDDQEYWG